MSYRRFIDTMLNSSKTLIDTSNPHENKITKECNELQKMLSNSKEQLEGINTTEIRRIIHTLKPKKSAGCDQISNFMIKKLPISYIDCLVDCFNQCLKECNYPEVWKLAKIITLNKLKTGVPKCDQIRPISLLATHSKIFEKIVLNRVRH
jgi:hypothetical protein